MKLIGIALHAALFLLPAAALPWLLAQSAGPHAAASSGADLWPANFKEIGAFALLAFLLFMVVKSVPFLVLRALDSIDKSSKAVDAVVAQFREDMKHQRAEHSDERKMARDHFYEMLTAQNQAYMESKKVAAESFCRAIEEMRADTTRIEAAINRLANAIDKTR